MLLVFACKNDPKQTGADGKETANNEIEKFPTNSYSRDSAKAAVKLKMAGQEPTPEKIAEFLKENKGTQSTGLPMACGLVGKAMVSKEMGVSETEISVTNGSRNPNGSKNSRSCFWRWADGGMLIQVSQNPLPDEIPNWTEKYIDAKKVQGERNIIEGKTVKYAFEDFKGPGTKNVYNTEIGRYYSVYQDKYVVNLIFNHNIEARKQLRIAKSLLEEVFKNLD
jgi:hypothetical protein